MRKKIRILKPGESVPLPPRGPNTFRVGDTPISPEALRIHQRVVARELRKRGYI